MVELAFYYLNTTPVIKLVILCLRSLCMDLNQWILVGFGGQDSATESEALHVPCKCDLKCIRYNIDRANRSKNPLDLPLYTDLQKLCSVNVLEKYACAINTSELSRHNQLLIDIDWC